MVFSIYHDLVVKSDKFSVYKAISEPEHLEHWWPLKCAGIAQIWEEYNFNFTDEYDWHAKVESCKICEHLHYKITKSDKDWNSMSFGFGLKEIDEGVSVRFFHVNWPECNAEYR